MTDQATLVAGIIVAAVGVAYTLVKVLGPRRPFNGETKEILAVLREMRDHLVGMGYEQRSICQSLTRVETSQQALHRRLDARTTEVAE